MQRHKSLVPLSRDHHEGLLLAVRLQQREKALLHLWSHDLHWQAEYVVKFFTDHLAQHFEEEENILFPKVLPYFKDKSDIIDRLINEHKELRSSIEFFRQPNESGLEGHLVQFGKLLEEHIRTEERELFPLCEKIIPSNTMNEIGKQISMHRS